MMMRVSVPGQPIRLEDMGHGSARTNATIGGGRIARPGPSFQARPPSSSWAARRDRELVQQRERRRLARPAK